MIYRVIKSSIGKNEDMGQCPCEDAFQIIQKEVQDDGTIREFEAWGLHFFSLDDLMDYVNDVIKQDVIIHTKVIGEKYPTIEILDIKKEDLYEH